MTLIKSFADNKVFQDAFNSPRAVFTNRSGFPDFGSLRFAKDDFVRKEGPGLTYFSKDNSLSWDFPNQKGTNKLEIFSNLITVSRDPNDSSIDGPVISLSQAVVVTKDSSGKEISRKDLGDITLPPSSIFGQVAYGFVRFNSLKQFDAKPESSFDLQIVPGITNGSISPSSLILSSFKIDKLNLPYVYPKEWATKIGDVFSKITTAVPKLSKGQLAVLSITNSQDRALPFLKLCELTEQEAKEFLDILKKVRFIAKRHQSKDAKLSAKLDQFESLLTPENLLSLQSLGNMVSDLGKNYKEAAEYLSKSSVEALLSDPITSFDNSASVTISADKPVDVNFFQPSIDFAANPGLSASVGSVQFRPDAVFNPSAATAAASDRISVDVNLKDVKITSTTGKAEDLVFTGKGSSSQSLGRWLVSQVTDKQLPFIDKIDNYYAVRTDFDDPKAYIKINPTTSKSEIAARVGVKGFVIPKVATIDEASIFKVLNKPLDFANIDVQGKVTINLLSDLSLAGKLTFRDYVPDTIIAEADNINKPIVAGIYLQRVKLGAANIANPDKPLTFTGGASATFGPRGFKLLDSKTSGGWFSQRKFKSVAEYFDKAQNFASLSLARADGDFAFNKEGFAGKTRVILLGLIDVSETSLAVNIKDRAFGYKSSTTVMGLLKGTMGVRANLGTTVAPPKVSVFFEGKPSNFLSKLDFIADVSARGLIQFSDNNDYSDDYVAVWGRATALSKVRKIPLLKKLSVDRSAGFIFHFDGKVDSFAGKTKRVKPRIEKLDADFGQASKFTDTDLERLFRDVSIPSNVNPGRRSLSVERNAKELFRAEASIPSNVAPVSRRSLSVEINGEDNGIDTSPTDSETLPTDSGTLPTDSGILPTDSGTLPTDSGTLDNPNSNLLDNPDSNPLDNPNSNPLDNLDSNPLDNLDSNPLDNLDSNPLDNLDSNPLDDLGSSNNQLDDQEFTQLGDEIEAQNEAVFAGTDDNSGDTNGDGLFDEADLPFDEDGVFEGLDSYDEDELDDEDPALVNPTKSFIASFDVPANNEYVTFVVNWQNRVADDRPLFALRGPDGEIYSSQDLTDVAYLSSDDPNDAQLTTLPKVIVDEDASNDFHLEIVVPKPMAGTWDLAMLDTDNFGEMKVFMEDPKEATTLDLGDPTVDAGGTVTIPYQVTAPDYSPSTIQFFRDFDGQENGYPISDQIKLPSGVTESSFTWDASELGSDKHYIYAIITPTDAAPVRVYADKPAEVTEPGSLAQVTNVGASFIGDNSVQVTWKKVPGAQAYLITYSSNAANPEDEDSSKTVQVTGFVDSVILFDLIPDETYAIHIRTIDEADDFGLQSPDAFVTVGEFTGQDVTEPGEPSVYAKAGQLYTQTFDLGEDVESVDILEAPDTAEFDPVNKVFSWPVPTDADGEYQISLRVTEGDGNEVLKNFQVFVGTPVPADLNGDDFNGFTTNGTADNYDGGIGDDLALGGDGKDDLAGGFGEDRLDGNRGADRLDGGEGDDEIYGGKGDDSIVGGDGNDEVYGDIGNDSIWGNAGDNNLDGGGGNDLISGGEASDYLWGGTGDDSLFGGSNSDVIYGGEGNDVVTGDEGGDELYGDAGNDLLNGNAGEDTLYGGQGNDTLTGNEDNDFLFGNRGNDLLTGDNGDDLIRGSDLNTGSEVDTLLGGAGADQFWLSEADGKIALYSTAGTDDYALIADFDPNVDRLILPGDNDALDPLTQYRFAQQQATSTTPAGLAIFVRKPNGSEDLIAIVQGVQPLTPESLLDAPKSGPDSLVSLNRPIQLFFGNGTGLLAESPSF